MYGKPIDSLVAARYSCRNYDRAPLGRKERDALEAFLAAEAKDHLGKPVRLSLVEDREGGERPLKLGTYGAIAGASLYLAGSFPRDEPRLEGYGYAFEKALLYATELGLGSCWLAGNVDRRAFSAALELKDGFFIPAVSPLGPPASKPNLKDALIALLIRPRARKAAAELFFGQDGKSPLSEADARRFARPLEALRLAPSARNVQPWRLARMPSGFRFFEKKSPGYAGMMGFDVQRLDIGIAMCHFELSAGEAGLRGRWEYEKDIAAGPDGAAYAVSWIQH
jgi:nitroreductase